jgi:hypothetical protein
LFWTVAGHYFLCCAMGRSAGADMILLFSCGSFEKSDSRVIFGSVSGNKNCRNTVAVKTVRVREMHSSNMAEIESCNAGLVFTRRDMTDSWTSIVPRVLIYETIEYSDFCRLMDNVTTRQMTIDLMSAIVDSPWSTVNNRFALIFDNQDTYQQFSRWRTDGNDYSVDDLYSLGIRIVQDLDPSKISKELFSSGVRLLAESARTIFSHPKTEDGNAT